MSNQIILVAETQQAVNPKMVSKVTEKLNGLPDFIKRYDIVLLSVLTQRRVCIRAPDKKG